MKPEFGNTRADRYSSTVPISFKVLLWQDVLGKEVDLWVAYTQLSFWQFYDFGNSSTNRIGAGFNLKDW